jgi:hypothetical protein
MGKKVRWQGSMGRMAHLVPTSMIEYIARRLDDDVGAGTFDTDGAIGDADVVGAGVVGALVVAALVRFDPLFGAVVVALVVLAALVLAATVLVGVLHL